MLRIGNKNFQKSENRRQKRSLLSEQLGFTLIEVMVTVAILSLGTLVIHQGLLRSADVLVHYNCELVAHDYMEDKLWDAKESLLYSADKSSQGTGGDFVREGRSYSWSFTTQSVPGTDGLYVIQMDMGWPEGNKAMSMTKIIYATSTKQISV